MLKYYLILIIVITISDGKIKIEIKTSNYSNRTVIKYEGSNINQVTDKEIQLFNITDGNLKRGVENELGKAPDQVFLKDPTIYGALFETYGWPDVRRKLSIKKATIVEFIKQDVTLKRNDHINISSVAVKSKTDMVAPVTNTVQHIWDKDGLPEEDIKYTIKIDFGYDQIVHNVTWRDSKTTTFDSAIRKSKGVTEILPGQSIVSKLLAEKVILLIEMEMEAQLVGNIVINYARKYGSHYIWAPTLGNIMKAAELHNGVTTKVHLEIRYYTNARLVVVDKDTGKEIGVKDKKDQKKIKLNRQFHFS